MADQTSDDEVFDFSNVEFTREDLVQALNDMVHEYKTLSHTFEEIKAENASLKNSSAESSSDEFEDTDSLKTELRENSNAYVSHEPSLQRKQQFYVSITDNFFSGTHKNSRTIEMASSSFTNAYLVDFDSVLEIPNNEGMRRMFKALETSGLRRFLGCKPVLYQSELGQFFDTALVQDEDITGAIYDKYFTVTPSRFAGVFELPTEGISNFSDVPKNQVYDARRIFSKSGEHVDTHGKKKFLKYEYRLLNDILGKSITSFLAQSIADFENNILHKIQVVINGLRDNQYQQQDFFRTQFHNSRQAIHNDVNTLSVHISEYRKGVQTFGASVNNNNLAIQRKIDAQQAKIDDLDTQVAAIRNDQLEFQTKIAVNILSLSTQISDIADFIRSGDAKKGEVGSSSSRPPIRVERRPLPTPQPSPDVQGSGATQLTGGGSAVRTPTFPPTVRTFAERVAMAQRHIIESGQVISIEEAVERVIEADRRESDRPERERARERRERRLRRRGPPTVRTFAERVAMAQRHIIESGQVISIEEAVERVIEADRRESDRPERERARERRERRLRRRGL
ncbi:hypothetical protein F511_02698 [Dorcoceras hygrometricum]|uniref:Uncharacterized protein n=1 Tax=Dorcoceras hygrometricum TaxID=472368 RepID=A0A2Z7CNY6_9LAMI|nr:hypothetical protein F511_02698 [Dorcoceras hygrometricum]